MEVPQQLAAAASAAASGPAGIATMGGAASAIGLGALTAHEVGILGGLFIGLGGLALQAWLGLRRDRREERESAAKIESQFGAKS